MLGLSADLLTAHYAALYADIRLAAPVPLFGPPGIADRLAGFLTDTSTRSPIESAFAITELYDGHQAAIGSLQLTSRAVAHGIPAFAVRIEAAGKSLVYSGDTASFPQQAVARASTRFDGPVDYAAPGAGGAERRRRPKPWRPEPNVG